MAAPDATCDQARTAAAEAAMKAGNAASRAADRAGAEKQAADRARKASDEAQEAARRAHQAADAGDIDVALAFAALAREKAAIAVMACESNHEEIPF